MIVVSSSFIIVFAVFNSIFLNSRSKLDRSVGGRFLALFFFDFGGLSVGASEVGGAMYSGAFGLRILSVVGVGGRKVDWEVLPSSV